jgi:hypothetical protein
MASSKLTEEKFVIDSICDTRDEVKTEHFDDLNYDSLHILPIKDDVPGSRLSKSSSSSDRRNELTRVHSNYVNCLHGSFGNNKPNNSTSYQKAINVQIKSLRWSEVGGIIIGDGLGSNSMSANWIASQLADSSRHSETTASQVSPENSRSRRHTDASHNEYEHEHELSSEETETETGNEEDQKADREIIESFAVDEQLSRLDLKPNTLSSTHKMSSIANQSSPQPESELGDKDPNVNYFFSNNNTNKRSSAHEVTFSKTLTIEPSQDDFFSQITGNLSSDRTFEIIPLSQVKVEGNVDAFIRRFISTQVC